MTTTPDTINVGDVKTLTCRFYSQAPDPTDPEAWLADPDLVVLTIKNPWGGVTTPTATRLSLGVWLFDYAPTIAGMHEIRWVGTGAIAAAEQEQLYVQRINTAA